MTVKYTKQEMLEELKRVSNKHFNGEQPTTKQMRKFGEINSATYQRRFGSWNEACRKAGIEITNSGGGIGKNNHQWRGGDYVKSKVNCSICGQEVERPEKDIERFDEFCCSNDCRSEMMSEKYQGKKNPQWKENTEQTYYGGSWVKHRENILERDQYKCRVCSTEEYIDVHHIKPAKTFEDNYGEMNDYDNLISLCRSCHTSVEGLWPNKNHVEFEKKSKEYIDFE